MNRDRGVNKWGQSKYTVVFEVPDCLYLQLGKTKLQRLSSYGDLFQPHIDGELLIDIRYALNKDLVLGTDGSKAKVEELAGLRGHPMKRGRPRA